MFARSPFPGMDPWLERHWGGVHHAIINDFGDQLAATLPANLYVEVEEELYIVAEPNEHPARVRPDVAVVESPQHSPPASRRFEAGGVIAVPIRIVLSDEPVTLGHLEIRSMDDDNPLVTAIEVLSPTNKSDKRARAEYIRKREAYYACNATVVELDLLRSGRPLIDVPMEYVDVSDREVYGCSVRRGGQLGRTEVEYYPLPLRKQLPRIRVPLRPTDDDVVIDLQPPIDHAYARGRYGTRLDYTRPLEPPLSPDDAVWAAERVAAAVAAT